MLSISHSTVHSSVFLVRAVLVARVLAVASKWICMIFFLNSWQQAH